MTLQLSTKAAIYTGIIGNEIPTLEPTCLTGNCTWPIFPSIAVCGECAPKAITIDCSKSSDSCIYSVSVNTSVDLLRGNGNEALKVQPIPQRPSLKDQGDTAYLSIFEIVTAVEYESKTTSTGFECALWACMNAYDTSMNDGHLKQTIISTWNKTRLENETSAHLQQYVFYNVPDDMNTLDKSRHAISTRAVVAIRTFMDQLTDGWYEDKLGTVNFSSDWVEAIHDAIPDMSRWMKRLTLSLSNEFRMQGMIEDKHNTKYEGSATKLASFVQVRWRWMLYAPLCLVISLYYLFATISATVRDDVAIWKGDSMPMLFSCIHPDILLRGMGMMDTHKGLDELGRHGIALAKAESGHWTFEPTVGPEPREPPLRRVFKWRD